MTPATDMIRPTTSRLRGSPSTRELTSARKVAFSGGNANNKTASTVDTDFAGCLMPAALEVSATALEVAPAQKESRTNAGAPGDHEHITTHSY